MIVLAGKNSKILFLFSKLFKIDVSVLDQKDFFFKNFSSGLVVDSGAVNAAPFLLSSIYYKAYISLLFSTGALRRTDGIVSGGGQSCQC